MVYWIVIKFSFEITIILSVLIKYISPYINKIHIILLLKLYLAFIYTLLKVIKIERV